MTEQRYAAEAEALREQLYRTAYLYLGGASQAVDAVDEAVYKGLRACGKLREERYFSTWLTRILINVCHTELRRRRRLAPLGGLPEAAQGAFDALPPPEAGGRVPPGVKGVVGLREFPGVPLAETARALDIPQGTAASRQRRALSLLRLELTDGEEAADR